jgi:hypothetical protein
MNKKIKWHKFPVGKFKKVFFLWENWARFQLFAIKWNKNDNRKLISENRKCKFKSLTPVDEGVYVLVKNTNVE